MFGGFLASFVEKIKRPKAPQERPQTQTCWHSAKGQNKNVRNVCVSSPPFSVTGGKKPLWKANMEGGGHSSFEFA